MTANEILSYPKIRANESNQACLNCRVQPDLSNVQVVLNIADLKELFLEWQSQVNNNAPKEEEVYLTPDEVASKYRTFKVTLWRNAKSGAWPKPIKVGGKTLYRQSEIEKVLNPDKIGG